MLLEHSTTKVPATGAVKDIAVDDQIDWGSGNVDDNFILFPTIPLKDYGIHSL